MRFLRNANALRTPCTVPAAHHITGLLLALSAVAGSSPLHAQQDRTLSYASPAEVGMSAEVLDGAVGLYREAVARGDLVGAVLLVARQGRVVLHEAVGLRDQASGLPMERGTLFQIGRAHV